MSVSVQPQVFLLAKSSLNQEGVADYLNAIGVPNWKSADEPSESEELIEIASRGCYMSYEVDLNANVTHIREGNQPHLENILNVGHGSVLEHATATWAFVGVSRVCTHEMVRHRLCAFSQQSLRFVRADDVRYRISKDDSPFNLTVKESLNVTAQNAERQYRHILERAAFAEGLNATIEAFETLPFDKKKIYTSVARRVLPIGLATNIIWSTNLRNLRHMIEMRTSPFAEEEIREVFRPVAETALLEWPNVFQDMHEVTEMEEWVTLFPKTDYVPGVFVFKNHKI